MTIKLVWNYAVIRCSYKKHLIHNITRPKITMQT